MNRFLVIVALLSGCASIDYGRGPVPGLENMTVEEHRVEATEIYRRCSICGHLGLELPTACTCINFRTNHAVIWLPHDATEATIEHERAHSRGYDHEDGALRSQFAAWIRRGGKRIDVAAKPVSPSAPATTMLTKLSELRSATPN